MYSKKWITTESGARVCIRFLHERTRKRIEDESKVDDKFDDLLFMDNLINYCVVEWEQKRKCTKENKLAFVEEFPTDCSEIVFLSQSFSLFQQDFETLKKKFNKLHNTPANGVEQEPQKQD